MKITKMSLVAALLVGSSAFAIDNVKVSGDAKLYYSTEDATGTDANRAGNTDAYLFGEASSAGQAAASISISADLTEGVSAGSKVTALTTLGLQGQLVSNVWEGTNGVTDSFIVNDLWIAATAGKTTVKVGRMELDTPLVFTEKWSIVENTFEAAVVINQDIPDTTLVGAYVGGSNGQLLGATANPAPVGIANVVQGTTGESTFNQFYNGAYAIGAINNSWAPLTAQAWYFDAKTDIDLGGNTLLNVNAYWLQADLNMEGILAGAQYTGMTFRTAAATIDSSAYAVMLGYEMKDVVTAKIAYSGIGEDHAAGMNLAGSGQSKLYTEAWWNYGYVTAADTTTYNLTVVGTVAAVDLGLYYTNATQNVANADDNTMSEITLSASKTFGPLDTSLVYINTDASNQNLDTNGDSSAYNTIQAYLTYNF